MFWRTVMSVGEVVCVLPRQAADDAKLAGGENAVGDADAHHEVIGSQAFAAFAAGDAHAVTLGVDAPPFEISGSPLGNHARAALAGKGAHLVERLPRLLLALEAFRTLGLGLFFRNNLSHFPSFKKTESPRQLWLYRGHLETVFSI
jgi:hypothetical protein